MAATEPIESAVYPCPECSVGSLHFGRAYFCTRSGGMFISAPNFPAWRCDVCGWREYDQSAVNDVHRLLTSQDRSRPRRRGISSHSETLSGNRRRS